MASPSSQGGFTFLELLIVAAILSLLAATTFVVRGNADAQGAVDFGAQEVASAIRFARAEAMRVGDYRAATIEPAAGRIKVAEASIVGGMPAIGAPVTHPINKRPYDFLLAQLPMAGDARITNASDPFTFVGLVSDLDTVIFDADGNPFIVLFGNTHWLKEAWVDVGSGDYQRKVTLTPHGRVVVQ